MSRANRKRSISFLLWEFKYVLVKKRGTRAWLKRQSSRLDRQMAKASLRDLDLEEWTEGEFEIPSLLPTVTSCNGSTIYLGS